VAAAIGDAGMSRPGSASPNLVSNNVIMRVTAAAVISGRAQFVRSAVVRIRANFAPDGKNDGEPVQILTWE
jgi:hypothetical protein